MKKESEGIVIETTEGFAKVKASRHGDCKNCGACPGDNATVVDAKNPIGAKAGEQNVIKAAFIVYIMPIISIFLGVLVGTWIFDFVGFYEMVFKVAGGLVFFIISLVYIKIFDRATAKNDDSKPVIKKVL